MRIGIDTYSFHRMLGFLREGEDASDERVALDERGAIALAAGFGVDVVAAQTCFLPPVPHVNVSACVEAAAPAELVPSWGAPNGLEFGANISAAVELEWWIDASAAAGCRLLRIVLGGPAMRGLEPDAVRTERSLPVLQRVADRAERRGVRLAIENHGDTGAAHVADILARLSHPSLGSCFDTANALRTGDDPVDAARILEPWVLMLHLKDVEPLERQQSHVSGPCSVPYGDGVVPIERVLDVLAAPIAVGAPVCVELGQLPRGADERAMVGASLAWLRGRAITPR